MDQPTQELHICTPANRVTASSLVQRTRTTRLAACGGRLHRPDDPQAARRDDDVTGRATASVGHRTAASRGETNGRTTPTRPCPGTIASITAAPPSGLAQCHGCGSRVACTVVIAAIAELWAPHNRRLLTHDRLLAAPRLPERTRLESLRPTDRCHPGSRNRPTKRQFDRLDASLHPAIARRFPCPPRRDTRGSQPSGRLSRQRCERPSRSQ